MTVLRSNFYDQVIALFKDGKTKDAAAAIDAAIDAAPLSEDALHLRLIKAGAIEYGEWVGGQDQQRAYHEYSQLEEKVDVLGVRGLDVYLGAARTLYRIDAVGNVKEIERLLNSSRAIGKSPHVEMLFGMLNENVVSNHELARKHYLTAFKMHLPWGLRFYARSHTAQRHFVRGGLAHILVTVLTPFMLLFFGAKGVLHENPWL